MATRIAWWLNLDAPLELEQLGRYAQRPGMRERARSLVERMHTLLSAHDVVLDGSRSASELPGFIALAFCPTPSALSALAALGFATPPATPAPLLRALTRRAFAARLGQTLPGAAYVESMSALEAQVARPSFTGQWLLKRDFSFAARERRRVREGRLDSSTAGFARRSFARGQGLQVEPYVERSADFALHGYVTAQGTLLLGDPMQQHCDERGVWQASGALSAGALGEREHEALVRCAAEAGRALQQAGYVGAFGVDAFHYKGEQGEPAFQPRSEVNVRFSMGYPRDLLERALALGEQGQAEV
jgi:hypothetical protein